MECARRSLRFDVHSTPRSLREPSDPPFHGISQQRPYGLRARLVSTSKLRLRLEHYMECARQSLRFDVTLDSTAAGANRAILRIMVPANNRPYGLRAGWLAHQS